MGNNALIVSDLGTAVVSEIVEAVKHFPIMKTEDTKFLQEHSQHLAAVMEHTYMWRTDSQKESIISDLHFPTTHAKFHQAILEQKVQFDQTLYLAKDFEIKKCEIEELECDLEELDLSKKRDQIKAKRIQIEVQFKQYEMKQMQIAMNYRMAEIKGWQRIQERLLKAMRDAGIPEQDIWNKENKDIIPMFLVALNNLQALKTCTDSAERSNLLSLATFTYKNIKAAQLLDKVKPLLSSAQQDSLKFIESFLGQKD